MVLNPLRRFNNLSTLATISMIASSKRQQVAKFRRGYAAATMDRLTADWKTESASADGEIINTLRNLRSRSRQEAMNNGYMKKVLSMVASNVIGPAGIILKNQTKMLVKAEEKGKFKEVKDTLANARIETAFYNWGKKKTCCANRKLSWVDVQRIAVKTWFRDGEVFVQKIKGFDNPFGFAVRLFEADYCDEKYNLDLGGGRCVRMGVELDEFEAPTAYYFLTKHPGDWSYPIQTLPGGAYRIRIPADQIEHLYMQDRPHQTRGVPEAYAGMSRLHMLGAYEDAEVVGARVGASHMGFYLPKDEEDDTLADEVEIGTEKLLTDAAPGAMEQLPPGFDFKQFDPKHPSGNFEPFLKAILRGIAAGFDVSYGGLSGDLSEANYSSARIGLLSERDTWKMIQTWCYEHFHDPIFESWLEMALLTGQVNLPFAKFDKFNAPYWQPRGFQWVDPLKEQEANENMVRSGFGTRAQVCAERGLDFEEVCQERAEEIATQNKYGVNFETAPQVKGAAGPKEEEVKKPDAKVTN